MRLRHLMLLSLCSLGLAFAACMLEPVDFTGKSCADAPCPDGLSCDPATLTCVEGALPDAGSSDPWPDAGIDDCRCSSGLTCCGGQCVDLTSDKNNCGACQMACSSLEGALCRNSECMVEVDAEKVALWAAEAPGPFLAFWKDGTLLAANDVAARNLRFDGTTVSKNDARAWSGRPTIYIPQTPGAKEVAIGFLTRFTAVNQDFDTIWSNDEVTCCGRSFDAFPLDPVKGQLYPSEFTVIDAVTGENSGNKAGVMSVHVQESTLIGPATDDTTVHKHSRADFSESFTPVVIGQPNATGGPNFNGNGAVTSDGGIVVTSLGWNLVAYVPAAGNSKWEKQVEAPTHPVLTPDGVIVVGAGKPGQDRVEAHRVSDGSKVWQAALPERARDLLVADNGLVYVATASAVFGIRLSDGLLLERYRLTGTEELLLRDGVIHAWGGGRVTAFKVTAKSYPKSSPWPVRYHDNQRTRSRTAPLDY